MRRGLAFAALFTIAIALGAMFTVVVWDARQQEAGRQVHFEISCGARMQRLFDAAMVRLHSMGYFEAERAYKAIAEIEPDCAMAYWGVAISRLKRPIAITPLPEDLLAAREALERARNAKIATPRERAYIAAAEVLIGGGDPAGWHDRTIRYEKAMAELAAAQPLDKEATIFYALALNMAALPSDKSFTKQTKAAELLLVALSEQPDHPGLTHYLTYCLSLPSDRTQHVSAALPPSIAASIQTALAMLALAGVAAFFVSVLPVWSGR
jgi:tetratricopeptide (TPR) repeat protein